MKLFLTICIIVSALNAHAQTKKALFLGNSYTAANNLPNLVYQLALSNGDTLIYDSNTPGGYQFIQHVSNATTIAKINAQDWDFVVLQEQSQKPSFPPSQVATDVYPYAHELDSMIIANNACTETVFYMTWGRKYGDQTNCASYPPLCTYSGMQDRLRTSYLEMANNEHAICAPVGSAWWNSISIDSTINLYTGDNSHPNINGSYLAACVFYATMWRKSPVGLSFTSTLSPSLAAHFQQVAHNTVFDSLDIWLIGEHDVIAGFDWTQNGLNTQFTDTSSNATSWSWDFDDGSGHTAQNPSHLYNDTGYYNVQLISSDGCTSDTASIQIYLSGSNGINEYGTNLELFPNPSSDQISLSNNSLNGLLYRVFDLHGKLVLQGVLKQSIDISDLDSGQYLLQIGDLYRAQFQKLD